MVSSRSSTTRATRAVHVGVVAAGDRAFECHARGEQPLDHMIVQVAGDTVAILEEAHVLLGRAEQRLGVAPSAHVAHDGDDVLVVERAQADLHREFMPAVVETDEVETDAHGAGVRMGDVVVTLDDVGQPHAARGAASRPVARRAPPVRIRRGVRSGR